MGLLGNGVQSKTGSNRDALSRLHSVHSRLSVIYCRGFSVKYQKLPDDHHFWALLIGSAPCPFDWVILFYFFYLCPVLLLFVQRLELEMRPCALWGRALLVVPVLLLVLVVLDRLEILLLLQHTAGASGGETQTLLWMEGLLMDGGLKASVGGFSSAATCWSVAALRPCCCTVRLVSSV